MEGEVVADPLERIGAGLEALERRIEGRQVIRGRMLRCCLLYTSDAADE